MTASSKLKGRWRWRLSSRTLSPSTVQTATVCPMIVMFGLVGSLAGDQRGKPACWWNVSCRWWQLPCRKCAVELAASEAEDATRWHRLTETEGLDKLFFRIKNLFIFLSKYVSKLTATTSLERSAAQSQTMSAVIRQFRRLLKTFLFGQWGHGAVWTVFNCTK